MLQLFARSSSGRAAAVSVVLVLAAATAAAQVVSGQVQQGGGSNVCCLTNFRFTGPCEVTVGAGESCSDVLAYLNNFQAAGRQYCGNTIIRGGWTQVRCGSTAGGVVISPDTIKAYEPSNITGATTMEPIGTTSLGTMSRVNATFITPIEASKAASAAEPGLIDL
jgi:hypothetical protein